MTPRPFDCCRLISQFVDVAVGQQPRGVACSACVLCLTRQIHGLKESLVVGKLARVGHSDEGFGHLSRSLALLVTPQPPGLALILQRGS